MDVISASALPVDLDAIVASIGDAQFVCLGEATHGTTEFYELRAELTKKLVDESIFSVVLVEGEWPAAYRLNRYLGAANSMDKSAEEALFYNLPEMDVAQ